MTTSQSQATKMKTTKEVKFDIFFFLYDNFVNLTYTRDIQTPTKNETRVTQLETCLNNKTTRLNRTIKLTN